MQGLFLGAGASYELGMPLVVELTETVRADHTPDLVRKFAKNSQWHKEPTDFFLNILANTNMHYEAVIGAIEVMAQRQGPHAKDYESIRTHLVDMVSRYLTEEHSVRKPLSILGLRYLEGLRKYFQEDEPLRVFSLNHDVMIEEICSFMAEPLKAGFYRNPEYCKSAFNGASIEFEFETLTSEQMKNGDLDFFTAGERGVNLYKLHGGLDTFLFNSCEDYVRFRSPGRLPGDHIQLVVDLQNANHKVEIEDGIRTLQIMTLRDSAQEVQFFDRSLITGAFKFTRNNNDRRRGLTVMFDKFKSDIYHVTNLTCIGYGFGDLHINEILVKWLCSSADHKLTIVDPFITTLPSFVLHLAPQVEIIKKSFFEHVAAPNMKNEKKFQLYMHKQTREYQRLTRLKKI
ncbi:hypothetical protein [Pseudomonas fluorescens]|uniref:hypothetical protein n=1 Tax=Pseudomonas fluorescens TaxID=294 RepID=UPI000F04FBEB|nr:hypothetical protein [Pseudomonas fluorescens]VVO02894.1 hypothetical protein PS720_02790 [Pseudomonas fluorescens]